MKRWISAFAMVFLLGDAAFAQAPLQGSFVAAKTCPAVQSIKKGTNAGDLSVEAGKSYRLLGKNKDVASHYWIEVPGASPMQRWVGVACGTINGETSEDGTAVPAKQKPAHASGPFYVLALSWEPAFCEATSDKAECQTQTAARYDASHFSLHGLWPQPRGNQFCNVDRVLIAADQNHRWQELPEPELSPATKARLDRAMPGTQSQLERHEWIKHGTCYPGSSAETYFHDAIRLIDEINNSPLRAFFAANADRSVSGTEIRQHFDQAFGAGAGQRLRIACKDDGNRRLIVEMTLGLKGDISAGTPLADLIAASSPTDFGCDTGVVDPAGLQ